MGEKLHSFEVTHTNGEVESYSHVIYFHSDTGCEIDLASGEKIFFPWVNVRKTIMISASEAQAA